MSDTGIQSVDFSVDLLQALIWQYGTKQPALQSLLTSKQAWYDANQAGFWNDWLTDVFDLRTANDFGLIVWAIILGFPLAYILPGEANTTAPFGFGPDTIGGAANGFGNFNNSDFTSSSAQQFTLTTDQKRLLLQLRYRQLVARGTVPEANKILNDLVSPIFGKCYMLDGLNMTQTIVCTSGIPAFLNFLLTQFDLIPRPACVKLLIIDGSQPPFGFGNDTIGGTANGNLNFNNSDFEPNLAGI